MSWKQALINFSGNKDKHITQQCWTNMLLNDCFDTTVRRTLKLWPWKTWKGHGKGHMQKNFKEYEP